MNSENFEFLKELVEAPSPSGFEQPAQRVFRKHTEPFVDALETDVMGNVIGRIDAAGADAAKIMLAGHCDEIGFMVKYIAKYGFLFCAPIGGDHEGVGSPSGTAHGKSRGPRQGEHCARDGARRRSRHRQEPRRHHSDQQRLYRA